MPTFTWSHWQVLPAYAKLDSAKAVKAARDDAGVLVWGWSSCRSVGAFTGRRHRSLCCRCLNPKCGLAQPCVHTQIYCRSKPRPGLESAPASPLAQPAQPPALPPPLLPPPEVLVLAYLEDEKGEEFKTFAHVADALRNGEGGGCSRLGRVAMVRSCEVLGTVS